MFTVRRALLDTMEGALDGLADKDAMNKLDPIFYNDMSQERVKVQLMVYDGEAKP